MLHETLGHQTQGICPPIASGDLSSERSRWNVVSRVRNVLHHVEASWIVFHRQIECLQHQGTDLGRQLSMQNQ